MASRAICTAALAERTRDGYPICPSCLGTRLLMAWARMMLWFEGLLCAEVRCYRCGFWMRPMIALAAYECILCGARGDEAVLMYGSHGEWPR